jgi:hypothetical protein
MIVTAIPVTRSRTGKTFAVAMSVLGVIGLAQLFALGWALATRQPKPEPAVTLINPARPAPFANPAPAAGNSGVADNVPKHLDLGQALPAPTPAIPTELPKPTPIEDERPVITAEGQVGDMVQQAKELRDRGDTGTALIRLREAQVIAPQNPQVIAELASTYESMGQTEKAMEYWRHIYDMGDRAGVYYTAAAAKVNPAPAELATNDVPGIQQGMTLGILDITKEERDDPDSPRHLVLHIPLKARPGTPIDVRDVVIQVFFYDLLPDASVVQTNANVNSHWSTPPVDWRDSNIEVLDVEYALPKPKTPADARQYFGYVARLYYKGDLQDWRADPAKLREMYPPPTTLQQDETGD